VGAGGVCWQRERAFLPQGVVPESKHGYFSMSPELSLIFACFKFTLRDKIPKNLFEVAKGLEFSFLLNLLQTDKGQQTLSTRVNCLYLFFPLGLIWTQCV
jgi:hypothetical protein